MCQQFVSLLDSVQLIQRFKGGSGEWPFCYFLLRPTKRLMQSGTIEPNSVATSTDDCRRTITRNDRTKLDDHCTAPSWFVWSCFSVRGVLNICEEGVLLFKSTLAALPMGNANISMPAGPGIIETVAQISKKILTTTTRLELAISWSEVRRLLH